MPLNIPSKIKLIECPRDAMQGWKNFIPTEKKIDYINALVRVGFDTIDFGSFVSAKAIPQMADTKEVIGHLTLDKIKTKLLAIVANVRGAAEALAFDAIDYLGFPFSISPTFQLRNTNSTIESSFNTVEEIQNRCKKNKKELVIYISMGFGNPYGDKYDEKIILDWVEKIVALEVKTISIADTVGLAAPAHVSAVLSTLISLYPHIEIGVHFHSSPFQQHEKIDAALQAGCKRFDGALKGIGGCPFANDDLVGNINTEKMIAQFEEKGIDTSIDKEALQKALQLAGEIFI